MVSVSHTHRAESDIPAWREGSSGIKSRVFPREHHELQKFKLRANQKGVGAIVGGSFGGGLSAGGVPNTFETEGPAFSVKRDGGVANQTGGRRDGLGVE